MIWLVCVLLAALVFSLVLLLRERCLRRRRIKEICRRLSDFEADGNPYEPIPREDDWAQLDRTLSHLTRYAAHLQKQSREESRQTAQLIADIAHQWKTPLASLKLYCELSLQQQEDPRERKKLTLIERMESMIEALLRLEKLQAKSYEMQFQDRDVLPLISEICQELSLHYPHKHFHLPADSLFLRIDPYWLREALINVIKNACQHTAEEGIIRISWKSTEQYDWILVEDNGGGVPEEALPHLFDRFYRTAAQGSGLGLSIARAICANHHGDIFAENTSQGLKVSLLLPRLFPSLRRSTE